MSADRSNFFYRRLTSLSSSYKDNSFDFKFSSRHMKIAVVGGDLEFVLNGADDNQVDGLIKATDGVVDFTDFEILQWMDKGEWLGLVARRKG